MKLVLGLVLGVVLCFVLSYVAENGLDSFDFVKDAWTASQNLAESKPAYCFDQDDPSALKAAVDRMVEDYNAGKDVVAICAE
ncbi:MAG: hypothetical protein OXC83_09590 [Chloroflexi bacterium]|nr:hypothetical protein [Chloroflexota bacterium]